MDGIAVQQEMTEHFLGKLENSPVPSEASMDRIEQMISRRAELERYTRTWPNAEPGPRRQRRPG